MVRKNPDITASRLHELLTYDRYTGIFRWRNNAGRWGRIPAGSIAGSIHKEGYRVIHLDGYIYRAAQLAWLYMTDRWPLTLVDHENRIRDDDRWSNLRLATDKQSVHNRILPNKHGVRGVSKKRNLWRARIMVDGKSQHIGYYATKEEAHEAYLHRARELHGEFFAE